MSGWDLLNHKTFCYQTRYGDAASWASVMQKKYCLLSSRWRSLQRLIWSKYDSFYYIFWTADSLAAKLDLMILHQKPHCRMNKIGLLHSGSGSQWQDKTLMFVQLISSKSPNIVFPNLVLWCTIMSQSVMQKDLFAIFKIKVTARAHYDQNMTISTVSFELLSLLLPNLVW